MMKNSLYNRRKNLQLVVDALQSKWNTPLSINDRDDILLLDKYKVSVSIHDYALEWHWILRWCNTCTVKLGLMNKPPLARKTPDASILLDKAQDSQLLLARKDHLLLFFIIKCIFFASQYNFLSVRTGKTNLLCMLFHEYIPLFMKL